jgi:hypothetical protein
MSPNDDDGLDSRFLETWKEWAGRPPSTSPAAAANRVTARLPQKATRHPRWLYAAAAAMICVAAAMSYLWVFIITPHTGTEAVTQQNAPLEEGVVLMWLDDKTPLYMNFQPPGGRRAQ